MPSPTWMTEPVSLTSTCLSNPLIFSLMIALISSALICIATPYLPQNSNAPGGAGLVTGQQRLHGVQPPANSAVHDHTADMNLQAGQVGCVGLERHINISFQRLPQPRNDA